MLARDAVVLVPPVAYIKKFEKKDGSNFYSFLFNKSKVNKETNEYYIAERYVINVMNLCPQEQKKYRIVEIIGCEPKTMKSKNGQEYLNCCIWCNMEIANENGNNTQYNNQSHNTPTYNTPNYNTPSYNTPNYNSTPTYQTVVDDTDLPF